MFKRALVPVDLNVPPSWKLALPVAEQFAADWGTELHAITVVPPMGYAIVGGHFPPDYEERAMKAAGEKLREAIAATARAPDAIHAHLAHGTIYEEILHAAERIGADIIVMTAHRPELRDYLIGPNAARVVRHAPQSVMVIREPG